MKIAVIGGGSTYTPELVDGLIARAEALGLRRLLLMDSDAERLAVVGGFCRRMCQHAGAGFALETTAALDPALDGADFVITQIRVGGQAGRQRDIQLGLRRGLIGQETTGVGGFAKALRTVPVVLDICRRMRRLCPDAWLINFTNPSGLVTEAVLKHGGQKVIGLCNIPVNMKMDAARLLGVEPERVQLDIIGLNHLSWVRRVLVDGRDVLPEALERLTGAGRPANLPEEFDYPDDFLRALGAIPNSYLRYYYATGQALAELQRKPLSRAEEVMAVEQALLERYRDPALVTKPAELEQRGGAYYSTAAVELMASLVSGDGRVHVVDVRNGATIGALPPDCAVEVPCRVDAAGPQPLALEPPGPAIRGLMQQVKAYEELAVAAAVQRDRQRAVLALVAHPLVGDAELALRLVDDIARAHGIEWSPA